MICVPPFRGELGLMIRYHVPAVRAIHRPLVVCHEPGLEALYPDRERIIVPARPDDERRDLYRKDPAALEFWSASLQMRYPGAQIVAPDRSKEWPEERFVPEPHVLQDVPAADIVVCPRYREYGAEKNWPAWPALTDALLGEGLHVFAAGARATSVDVGTPAAWHHDRELDASIEAIRSARLVIATDAGLAHLAVLCGAPLLLIGYGGGLVAPGKVTNERGRVVGEKYWPIRLDRYYHAANHTGSPIEMEPHGWESPGRVVARALEMLATELAT
jgi:hypothetical protein